MGISFKISPKKILISQKNLKVFCLSPCTAPEMAFFNFGFEIEFVALAMYPLGQKKIPKMGQKYSE